MLDISKPNYSIKKDIEFIFESECIDIETLSKNTGLSKATLYEMMNGSYVSDISYEKLYSYIYDCGYRINRTREEFLRESKNLIVFHGSKEGLHVVDASGARENCDFGKGFYLSESYSTALQFVCENTNSTIYSFVLNLTELNVVKFDCSLDWMLTICYYRGTIKPFEKSTLIKNLVKKIEGADVIIAPIADNRMFYIMSLFANGDINSEVAVHSLSASNLGLQYVIKTEKALKRLKPQEKYYLCSLEKIECQKTLEKRVNEIETKLKMARREYRNGLFVEEILK